MLGETRQASIEWAVCWPKLAREEQGGREKVNLSVQIYTY